MPHQISVVIPTLRKSKRLFECISSVCHAAYSSELKTEVIIVDNSGEKTHLDEKKFNSNPFTKLRVLTSQTGANVARNLGIQQSQAEIIFLLDDDCVLEVSDNSLEKHFKFHSENPDLFACGGLYSAHPSARKIDRHYVNAQNLWLSRGIDLKTQQANYLLGGHVSFKKSFLFNKKLFFDEQIKYGGSETEFFVRAKMHNLKSTIIDSSIYHFPHLSLVTLCQKSFKQGYGKRYRENKLSLDVSNQLYIHKPDNKNASHSVFDELQKLFFKFGYAWFKIISNGRSA
jgi:glycosyltransferase involved in cell wall biosynthesis